MDAQISRLSAKLAKTTALQAELIEKIEKLQVPKESTKVKRNISDSGRKAMQNNALRTVAIQAIRREFLQSAMLEWWNTKKQKLKNTLG